MKKDILDVRKVIEKSTSKVSLRDLEKKGFRKVKVLRAGDINQLIYKAVQTVLAKQSVGLGEAEREQVMAEAKAEYERQTKQLQELQETQERVESEKAEVEQKAREIEEAKKRLETKVGELNVQLVAERNRMIAEKTAFAEEKKQLEREKQNLYEKGFDAVKTQQLQAQDLQAKLSEAQARLQDAEARARASQEGSISPEVHQQVSQKVEDLERKLRKALHDVELEREGGTSRLRGTQQALEEAEGRVQSLQSRLAELEGEVGRYRSKAGGYDEAQGRASKLAARVGELESELEATKSAAAARSADPAEVTQLREELAAARAKLEAQGSQTAEMFTAVLGAVKDLQSRPVAAAAAGPSGDMDKQFKALQQTLTDQFRKMAGAGVRGGGMDESGSVDIGALMARNETVQLETNIKDVGVKEQSAKGVKDKLNKLKNMRGGGPK